ncbi:MAG: diadenylate cyclase [Ignavibacteriae bacterium]|nr:diadenylate cyclase [Ignavibacteriota bacterium]
MPDVFIDIGISDVLDIVFMTAVIYSTLVWFRRTRGGFAVLGLFIFGAAYLIARQLDLTLTTTVFQGFFAIILIAIVILFQEEIKHFLEQLASRSILQGKKFRRQSRHVRKPVEVIVNTVKQLVHDKTGALIVIRGKDPIERHLKNAVSVNGVLTEELVGSIFTPSSPGHDGAVVVEGDRVVSFACYLPLSGNLRKLQKAGTRHAAALGLAELTDALVLVVSEERGTISVAQHGNITALNDADALQHVLNLFYDELHPSSEKRLWRGFFTMSYRELAIALVATVSLWFFFVHEARVDYRTYMLPVTYEDAPAGMAVEEIDPQEIEVTFSGQRRSFWFVDNGQLKVTVKLLPNSRGIVRRTITRSEIVLPEGLTLENIQPNQVTLRLGRKNNQPGAQ